MPSPPESDPKAQRDSFVHTFFKKGAEFTEELVRENDRLRQKLMELESENTALRTQLASDEAIRDLLRKITELERDKETLLSAVHEQEVMSTRVVARHEEMEAELSNLANLYVASYQLHSTLRLPSVLTHLRELLAQLVGAKSHAYYVASRDRKRLVPVASDGIALETLPRLVLGADDNAATLGILERVFLTGVPYFDESFTAGPWSVDKPPAAAVPMRIDDVVVGVFVVFSLLAQKDGFAPVDYELFKMLGAHAATALVGALLLADAQGKLPGLDALATLGT